MRSDSKTDVGMKICGKLKGNRGSEHSHERSMRMESGPYAAPVAEGHGIQQRVMRNNNNYMQRKRGRGNGKEESHLCNVVRTNGSYHRPCGRGGSERVTPGGGPSRGPSCGSARRAHGGGDGAL
jgi:hypothetical protein